MITFSSYNKFSNNLLLDVWVIALVNACTSLLAGIIVFSTMGNLALEQGRNITDVVAEGRLGNLALDQGTKVRLGILFFRTTANLAL